MPNNDDEKKIMPESEAIAMLQKQLKEKDDIIADKDKTILQLINDAGKSKDDSKEDSKKEKEDSKESPEDDEAKKRDARMKYYKKMLER